MYFFISEGHILDPNKIRSIFLYNGIGKKKQ